MDESPSLTPEQRAALEDARQRAKGILSAAKVAAFNGWTIGFFAVLTAVFGLTAASAVELQRAARVD
jgi:hypothetical protein